MERAASNMTSQESPLHEYQIQRKLIFNEISRKLRGRHKFLKPEASIEEQLAYKVPLVEDLKENKAIAPDFISLGQYKDSNSGMSVSSHFETLSTKFLDWFCSIPCTSFHPALKIVDFRERNAGRGIIATADIPADSELFIIPRNAIISVETTELAKRLPNLFSNDESKEAVPDGEEEDLPRSWLNLILILLYEYFHKKTSRWSPYLSVLPQAPRDFNTLMFWTDQELLELQASAMSAKIGKDSADRMFTEHVIPLIKRNSDIFYPSSDPHLSDSELLDKCHIIGSLIMSYAFDLQPDEDQSETSDNHNDDGWTEDTSKPSTMGMVPMADMLNADAEFNAHLSHGDDALTMTSLRDIKAGEQVLNYYGPLPNGELLRRYGYTSSKHSRHDVVEIGWAVVEESLREIPRPMGTGEKKWKQQIEDALQAVTQEEELDVEDGFVLEREAGEPNEQGLHIREAQFTNFPEELVSLINDVLEKLSVDESKKRKLDEEGNKRLTRSRMLAVLANIVRKRVDQYTTTLKEDGELLRDGNTEGRLKMAVEVRLGEKVLLEEALRWTIKMQQKYEDGPRANGGPATASSSSTKKRKR